MSPEVQAIFRMLAKHGLMLVFDFDRANDEFLPALRFIDDTEADVPAFSPPPRDGAKSARAFVESLLRNHAVDEVGRVPRDMQFGVAREPAP